MKGKRKVLITIGDVAGIGPEISIKAALKKEVFKKCLPILIGHRVAIEFTLRNLNIKKVRLNLIKDIDKDCIYENNVINIITPKKTKLRKYKLGEPSIYTGRASFEYLKIAADVLSSNNKLVLVTAPISKEAWKRSNVKFKGHTEALAVMSNTLKYAMAFVNDKVKVILVTRHIALSQVSKKINKKTVQDAIDLGLDFLNMLKINKKRIGITSINPHIGDNGLIGDEEVRFLIPFIKTLKYKDAKFNLPESADSIFFKAINNKIDLVIAMYHDQGITPLKVMSYYKCVNITLGLPFVRTSPGHGVAFDIADKYKANPDAMVEAIKWGLKLKKNNFTTQT